MYLLQVSDSLMNIAPCGRTSLGEPAFLSEELAPLCQVIMGFCTPVNSSVPDISTSEQLYAYPCLINLLMYKLCKPVAL